MPTVTPSGLTGYVRSETLSDALFAPMGILKRARYQTGLQILPHDHGGSCQFLLVLSGETHFIECGISRFVCTPGCAIIVPAHCEHWWRMEEETVLMQFDYLPFSQRAFGHLALLFGPFQKRLVAIDMGVGATEKLMSEIEGICSEGIQVAAGLISAALLTFLARLVDHSHVLTGELGHGMHPGVVRAIAYIDRHVRDPLSVDELSRHAHLGPSRLCQLFREQVGAAPLQYIAEKRVQLAERMLLNPSMTIGEVAHALGFSSANYFSRFFKKHCGVSPSASRVREAKLDSALS
ncbi:MAG: helix-turn-helix domain-containing protein [Lentisphaerae bacterium]|jgi:AraC-like DNA-binding protein|nr:helix-turn-helix domain-containing protein [Lentisphaerota bacterium]MBT4818704.1 helix-turn-helix domain-containing protein [Lentisphaerota bacterium]MBT5605792.1 helix-turn-helix domain-containing protein [Lentisphaerota bacterium]MBT7055835.1 helix-turn-helix domain-containing protein [Lentisphaerota bacterium]MBT7847480.1 helix-turn-helix domain-containing protein [Lentisphaerota bacterium]